MVIQLMSLYSTKYYLHFACAEVPGINVIVSTSSVQGTGLQEEGCNSSWKI